MPLSIGKNIRDRVWDDVGPKMITTLQSAGYEGDVNALAEELFEKMWPGIFGEITLQTESILSEVGNAQLVQARRRSLSQGTSA